MQVSIRQSVILLFSKVPFLFTVIVLQVTTSELSSHVVSDREHTIQESGCRCRNNSSTIRNSYADFSILIIDKREFIRSSFGCHQTNVYVALQPPTGAVVLSHCSFTGISVPSCIVLNFNHLELVVIITPEINVCSIGFASTCSHYNRICFIPTVHRSNDTILRSNICSFCIYTEKEEAFTTGSTDGKNRFN